MRCTVSTRCCTEIGRQIALFCGTVIKDSFTKKKKQKMKYKFTGNLQFSDTFLVQDIATMVALKKLV